MTTNNVDNGLQYNEFTDGCLEGLKDYSSYCYQDVAICDPTVLAVSLNMKSGDIIDVSRSGEFPILFNNHFTFRKLSYNLIHLTDEFSIQLI